MQGVDLGPHGLGTKQTLAGLSPSLSLWARSGSGSGLDEGGGFLQALGTLAPSLKSSPWG